MDFFISNIYTVILVPLWICLIILLGKLFAVLQSRRLMAGLTLASSLYVLIFSIAVFAKNLLENTFTYEFTIPFIKINEVEFSLGVYLDGISTWLLLVVAVISLLVQIYSYSYMQNDKSFMRFFAYMNLFSFSMIGLVLSPNMFQTYVFWELVGVSSYLLIGFWYKKESASIAAKKAFIMNSIGDFALLSGIIMAGYILYSNYDNIVSIALPFSDLPAISDQIYAATSDGIFIILSILLVIASIAKSAQFPLNTWLVDAMEGPTPVSALIHSATMVAAGVYLLCRLYPLYSLNSAVLTIIAVVGIVTAIICSISAISQTDIKKMLAYSTSAQLGLMFLALGVCSITATMVHLTAHSFIKAMLFLIAGVVIVSQNGNQDIKLMGGLRTKLPTSAIAYLIGALSLSGLLFAGFASKDLILGNLLSGKHYVYATLFLIVAFMTAYYLFRAYFYIFEGENKSNNQFKTPDVILNVIIGIFAIIIIFLWFIFPKSQDLLFKVITYIIGISAIAISYLVYANRGVIRKIPVMFDISYNGFYLDNIYLGVVKGYKRLSRIAYLIDKYVFDAISYLFALNIRFFSWILSKLQTGKVQSYLSYALLIIMLCFGGLLLIYNLIVYFSEV